MSTAHLTPFTTKKKKKNNRNKQAFYWTHVNKLTLRGTVVLGQLAVSAAAGGQWKFAPLGFLRLHEGVFGCKTEQSERMTRRPTALYCVWATSRLTTRTTGRNSLIQAGVFRRTHNATSSVAGGGRDKAHTLHNELFLSHTIFSEKVGPTWTNVGF